MKKQTWRLGELYCGPGGLAWGALAACSSDHALSLKHTWSNDIDHDSVETYRRNICPNNPESVKEGDVKDLDLKALGQIEAFAYGFPCNSFSNIGEHKGLDDKKFGQLYSYGIEILRIYRPKFFIAENVSGIRSAGNNNFHTILKEMRDSGYRLNVNLYKAEEYGIPQTRHRIVVVGIRDDLGICFKVPDPKPYSGDICARTALSEIPTDAPNNEKRHITGKVVRRLQHILPGQNIWEAQECGFMPQELQIKTNTTISQIYRKLDPDKPSYTVTASGGGGTSGYHWENRELTNRERARLQTFPDKFEFIGSYASIRKQIGMAVPCKLAKIITTAILNSFRGIAYPSIKSNLDEYNKYNK